MKTLYVYTLNALLILSLWTSQAALPSDSLAHASVGQAASLQSADGPSSLSGITIVVPANGKAVTTVGVADIIGRINSREFPAVQLLAPKTARRMMSLPSKGNKAEFPKSVKALFPENFVLTSVQLTTFEVRKKPVSSEYNFDATSNTDLKAFWNSLAFRKILTEINRSAVTQAELVLRGLEFREQSIDTGSEHSMFSFSQVLAPGMNTLYLRARDGNKGFAALDSVELLYDNKVQAVTPGDDFQHIRFHASALLGETGKISTDSVSSSCVASCHRALTSLASFHPMAEECSLCHDLSSGNEVKLIEKQELNQEFCFNCHDDKKELLGQKAVVHPVATECLTCHDPHGTQYAAMQRDRTTELCKTCHEANATQPHPVNRHPMEGVPDPSHPGKELSCVSCHNPHASDFKFLLREDRIKLCQYCHNK